MEKDGFLWGVASSAHQVEEVAPNEWVDSSSKIVSEESKTSVIDKFLYRRTRKSDRIKEQMSSDKSYSQIAPKIAHDKNYQKDYDMAEQIGVNSVRLSISWARIEPSKGNFSDEAIQHYRDVIEYIRSKNMTPVVTIWHFTHPQWFFSEGGWSDKESVKHFERFVRKIVTEFGDIVDYWVTLNEPVGWIRSSHIFNNFPPQKTRKRDVFRVFRNMYKAHNNAYNIIKSNHDARVGISATSGCFEGYKSNRINKMIARLLRYVERDAFLDKCKENLDYIGVNNYYHCRVDILFRNQLTTTPRSDLNWPLSSDGLACVCEQMYERYELPIIVTEHGLADYEDKNRGWYIDQSVRKLKKKQDDGVPINGYFHWSLIDNIEWDSGRWPRFGLIEMDYETGERRLRDSSEDYKRCIETIPMEARW